MALCNKPTRFAEFAWNSLRSSEWFGSDPSTFEMLGALIVGSSAELLNPKNEHRSGHS
jgi:hypothetical protein